MKLHRRIDLRAHYAGHVIDFVNDGDRRWFVEHPDQTEYTRPAVAGEMFPVALPPGTLIRVVSLRPGVRARQTILPVGGAA